MIVLGIDPGSAVTGYGLIDATNQSSFRHITFGVIRTGAAEPLPERLKKIYKGITRIIAEFNPSAVAFEDVFYGRNVQSALKLGQARGAAIMAAVNADKTISTYSAREVKQSLTGYGAASKEQVQRMIQDLLKLKDNVSPMDASDALAIAICHAYRCRTSEFIKNNIR